MTENYYDIEAQRLYEEQQTDEAIMHLVHKLQHHEDYTGYLQLSSFLMGIGDSTQAQQALTQAEKLAPGNSLVLYNQGIVAYETKNYDRAKDCLKPLLNKPELKADVAYSLALIYFQEKNWPQALAFALSAVDWQPYPRQEWLLLANIYGKLQLWQQAYEAAQQAQQQLTTEKELADVAFVSGLSAVQLHKTKEGFRQLRLAEKLNFAKYQDIVHQLMGDQSD